jgi:PIN domain nuclease of toxin-antitoxin system
MTEAGLLFDTCAILFLSASDADDVAGVRKTIDTAQSEGWPMYLSPITAWEVGMLASKGRLSTALPVEKWLASLMTDAGLGWAGMPPDVLIESSFLPGTVQGDPSDRIIIATARCFGLRIVTRDRAILDYAKRGHVLAVAC